MGIPLRAACISVLLCILVAGLWPFHAPRNQVSWLEGNGLLFGRRGSIVTAGSFKARALQDQNSCSLEVWLKPSRVDNNGMILGFYWPESAVVPFALRQYQNRLVIERGFKGRIDEKAVKYVADVFITQKPVLVTITSSNAGTATYVDGALVKKFSGFTFSNKDLTGRLVVGNAPSTGYSWSGQVKGLAVYDRDLSAVEVSQSFVHWTEGSRLDSVKSENLVARYRFDEGNGNVVHNQVDSATDLLIPERFFVLHQQFLELPWDEFYPGWSYWKNIAINVVGFIPLGFVFRANFSRSQKSANATAGTIVLGFAVSLTIEVLQAFLPSRDSGTTDLITNTLGTAIGVIAFNCRTVQHVLLDLDCIRSVEPAPQMRNAVGDLRT